MNRLDVFARDGYRCVYCGGEFPAEELTVDHVQPRMRGGDHSGGNVVSACRGCNTEKGGARLADYLRANPLKLAHFLTHAVHVWPRHLRTLRKELGVEA